MKKSPKTSVIIPVYNEPFYLEKCLTALHQQTVPIDEIIVVDNNSTDDSIKKARKQFPDVIFLEEKKQGIVYARNTGFDAASGDVLIKIDADTVAYPGWIENLLESMIGHDGWSGYIDNTELNRYFQGIAVWVFNHHVFSLNKFACGFPMMFGSNCALTRDAWQIIKPGLHMRNDIWEDLDMAYAMHAHGLSVKTSRFKGVSISARSANASVGRFYARSLGQPRVHRLNRFWRGYILSLITMHLGFLSWIVLKPLSTIGKTIKKRPRPEQY